jgi:hypothetical protein
VSFVAITLCVASQRVFIFVSVYFVIDGVRKLLDTPSTAAATTKMNLNMFQFPLQFTRVRVSYFTIDGHSVSPSVHLDIEAWGCSQENCKSHDSSVGIALGYGLDHRGSRVRFPAGSGNFSLHHRVQNGSGTHPTSYPIGTRGSFPGGKAAGA